MTPERLAEVLEALADGPPWNTAWLRSLLPELAVRGRLVAQEVGHGQRMDEMFAGTPSLMMVKAASTHAAEAGPNRGIMILDVKCAFLYGEMRRNVYIELPHRSQVWGCHRGRQAKEGHVWHQRRTADLG